MIRIFAIIFFLFVLSGCEEARFDRKAMLTNIADKVVIPAFENFKKEADTLHVTIEDLQKNLDKASLEKARLQWVKTAAAWHRCQIFVIGKYRESFIYKRIYTAPPKMEYVERIINGDEEINSDLIMSKGSNIVGLPAVEYILFDGEKTLKVLKDSQRKMAYLKALTETVKSRAETSLELWSAGSETYKEVVDSPGIDNGSGISMLFNRIIYVAEKLTVHNIGRPLGKQIGKADTKKLVSWKSGQSLELIKSNFAVLKDTFTGEQVLGFDDYLDFLERDIEDKLSKKILEAIHRVEKSLSQIESLEKSLQDNSDQVDGLYKNLKALLVLLKVDAANRIGITVTFSDNDGD